jgi:hypothetical protein
MFTYVRPVRLDCHLYLRDKQDRTFDDTTFLFGKGGMVVLNIGLEVKLVMRPMGCPHSIDKWVCDFRIVEGLIAQPLLKD